MTIHREKRFLAFSPDELFEIVSDIESYPLFLPWVSKAKIHKNDVFSEKGLIILDAEIYVQFKLVKERFRSKVSVDKLNKIISTTNIDGPFKRLNNEWVFKLDEKGCEVSFEVDFQFKSIIFHNLFNAVFHKAMEKVIFSFENRAKELYR